MVKRSLILAAALLAAYLLLMWSAPVAGAATLGTCTVRVVRVGCKPMSVKHWQKRPIPIPSVWVSR